MWTSPQCHAQRYIVTLLLTLGLIQDGIRLCAAESFISYLALFCTMPRSTRHCSPQTAQARRSPAYHLLLAERAHLRSVRQAGLDQANNNAQSGMLNVQPPLPRHRSSIATARQSALPTSNPHEFSQGRNRGQQVTLPGELDDVHYDGGFSHTGSRAFAMPTFAQVSSANYTNVELAQVDDSCSFTVPSPVVLGQIRRDAVQSMSSCFEPDLPCCVCELDCDHETISTKIVTEYLLDVRSVSNILLKLVTPC